MLPALFESGEPEEMAMLTAPVDSELAVAQNHHGLEPLLGATAGLVAEKAPSVSDWWDEAEPFTRPRAASDVGFEPEVPEDATKPFYAKCNADGTPKNPPVQAQFG